MANRRIAELEAELAIHRRASELLGRWCPRRRFEAIAVMAAEGLSVQLAVRVLAVSESGYYFWRNRPPSQRAIRHAWLTDVIRFARSGPNQLWITDITASTAG